MPIRARPAGNGSVISSDDFEVLRHRHVLVFEIVAVEDLPALVTWVVTGNNSTSYTEGKAGLNKYDGKTGQLMMTVDFSPGSCDPHRLVWHDGGLVSCDVGIHPGWKGMESPHTGYTFSIEIV